MRQSLSRLARAAFAAGIAGALGFGGTEAFAREAMECETADAIQLGWCYTRDCTETCLANGWPQHFTTGHCWQGCCYCRIE